MYRHSNREKRTRRPRAAHSSNRPPISSSLHLDPFFDRQPRQGRSRRWLRSPSKPNRHPRLEVGQARSHHAYRSSCRPDRSPRPRRPNSTKSSRTRSVGGDFWVCARQARVQMRIEIKQEVHQNARTTRIYVTHTRSRHDAGRSRGCHEHGVAQARLTQQRRLD